MKKTTPIILVNSLDVERGGITRASIKRANMLSQHNKNVMIITFAYQQYFNKIIQKLYDKNILSKHVKVINFFEEMQLMKKKTKAKKQLVKEKGYTVFPVENRKKEPSYRYYKNGLYIMYKRFNAEGCIKFIDYMDETGKRVRREEYNENGILARTRHMDNMNNKPRFDQYFDTSGNCIFSVYVNPKSDNEGRVVRFIHQPKEFTSLSKCQQEWLESVLQRIKYPVVSSELRKFTPMLANVQHKNIKKIEVIHSSHLQKPFNDNSMIKPAYQSLFKELASNFDYIVFLTNEQKQDVEKVYGANSNFRVIPHSTSIKEERKTKNTLNYNPYLAVTLARLHEVKRLEEAIRAFRLVVDKLPKAQYYIYGNGNSKEELQALIKNLKLQNNVFLKSYTNSPQTTYRNAACSILTSRQEGFAMVITESMAVGTPVISYNIKYGPKDIITDGIDGHLVEDGSRQALAKKIIDVMENEKYRKNLSTNALKVKKTFSEKRYNRNWLELYL
ncbi:glycosyltransferase [Virgibacillus salexigens]|uniref:glycosyltransferase n=1 Tax=Virgibacillus salexigens TaxID=61016 RepID=UPI003081BA00